MGSLERLSLYCDGDLRKRLVYKTSRSEPSYCLLLRKVKAEKPNNLILSGVHAWLECFPGLNESVYGFVVSALSLMFKNLLLDW